MESMCAEKKLFYFLINVISFGFLNNMGLGSPDYF